jgi:hypothetical protein
VTIQSSSGAPSPAFFAADERRAGQRLRPINVNKAFDSIEIYQRWKTFDSS